MDVVQRRLSSLAPVSENLQARLATLAQRVVPVEARSAIRSEGEPAGPLRFLRSGWACRQINLNGGRRQIFDLLLPGDCVGAHLRPDVMAKTTVIALTPVELLDASELSAAVARNELPDMKLCLAEVIRHAENRLCDQVLRLGRLSATQRMAHLLLELHDRLAVVDMAADGQFILPVTQEVLADTLGVSFVHVNRTLQELRRSGLITLKEQTATLLDREALVVLAHYRTSHEG